MFHLLLSLFLSWQSLGATEVIQDEAKLFNNKFLTYWTTQGAWLKETYGISTTIISKNNLEGENIKTYIKNLSLEKASEDKYIIILTARAERQVEIYLSSSLRSFMEIEPELILQKEIMPYFKKAYFSAGLHNGLMQILASVEVDTNLMPKAPRELRERSFNNTSYLLLMFFCLIVIFLNHIRFSKRKNTVMHTSLLLGGSGSFGRNANAEDTDTIDILKPGGGISGSW